MYTLWPDKDTEVKKAYAAGKKGRVPLLIVRAKDRTEGTKGPGVLWIHGGGYFLGMKEMVFMSRAKDLVKNFNATVISPGYTLSFVSPYPKAVDDCYGALLYLKENAPALGIDENHIIVGGESAGGGLCAAVCMMARDKKEVKVSAQFTLYPMLSNLDTASSRDNHGKVWNTWKNHLGWKLYLRKDCRENVSPYASPSRQTDYRGLPPLYTFVGNGEPFYQETVDYVECLKKEGIEAQIDIYDCNIHAFDMLKPEMEVSKKAVASFNKAFGEYLEKYSLPQKDTVADGNSLQLG